MGCICPVRDATTVQINREQQRDQIRDETTVKLLFLGAGGSGKSTLFKQLRLLYGDGLQEVQRSEYISNIHGNLINGIKTLLEGNLNLADDRKIKRCEEKLEKLIEGITNKDKVSSETSKVIQMAWADPGMQEAWTNRSELQLQDSLAYFVANVERISSPGYIPNMDDVLNVRAVTTGIVEEEMSINGKQFHIVDVGGQRSERRKWINCFDDVTGLIFVASLISYNQVLYEDETTNRMKESLNLFKNTVVGKGGKNFQKACIVLFLNKNDLFTEVIKNYPITKCFTSYKGPLTEEDQYNYIMQKYKSMVAPREIFVHRTCATNTDQIEVIFNIVNLEIIKRALTEAGLMNL